MDLNSMLTLDSSAVRSAAEFRRIQHYMIIDDIYYTFIA